MPSSPPFSLPVPPALVYLLNQLDQAGIRYHLYGEVVEAELVFVDIDRAVSAHLQGYPVPRGWSLVAPHFLSQRALSQGDPDPIAHSEAQAETIVLAYGAQEAQRLEDFHALCDQVRYLKQQAPSRLVYHSLQPPDPMQIHAIIKLLKQF